MTSGTATTATAVLRDEHRLILEVVSRLSGMLDAERNGDPLDYDTVGECITFFRLFADACHHGKEEDLLFPELEEEGMPHDSGPIAMLLEEHVEFRALVQAMAAALPGAADGDPTAGSELRDAATVYLDRIQAHIGKEDHGLFELADGMIVGPRCVELCARYDEVCARRFEGQTLEDLERLAGSIMEVGAP
jgi:hemerythrin-like domain-containing protein